MCCILKYYTISLLHFRESSLANASGSSLEKSLLHHTSINSSIQNNDHERKVHISIAIKCTWSIVSHSYRLTK